MIAKGFDREGVADTGDDVFALGLEEDCTIEDIVLDAGDLVAGEVNARCRTRRAVTEDHFLNVDGGAEAVRNTFELAGEDGALVVPRTENGFCGGHNLFLRILRELVAILDIDGFVALDEFGEVIGGQVEVGLGAFLFLEVAEGLFERIFAVFVFDLLNNIAVHLEETTIAVTPETGGVADGQSVNDLIGEADVVIFIFNNFMFAVLSLRDTHGFRRYALRAYAPLRPAMCSTAARSVRIRRVN